MTHPQYEGLDQKGKHGYLENATQAFEALYPTFSARTNEPELTSAPPRGHGCPFPTLDVRGSRDGSALRPVLAVRAL